MINYNFLLMENGSIWKKPVVLFFVLFLITLPFFNLEIINTGIPIKFSELLIVSILLIFFYRRSDIVLTSKVNSKAYLITLSIFSMAVVISFIFGITHLTKFELYEISRINPSVDSVFKTLYIMVSCIVFFIVRAFLSININLIKYYFIGVLFSSLVSIYFFICGIFDISPQSFACIHYQFINLGNTHFIRNGTFLEGNFAGLYFLIALILAEEFNQKKLFVVILIAIASTFSTVAIACTLLFLFFVTYRKPINIVYVTFMILLLLGINLKTDGFFFKEQFVDKISFLKLVTMPNSSLSTVTSVALSGIERSEMINIGIQMFKQNMLFGVGPANYKYYFLVLRQNSNSTHQLDSFDTNIKRPMISNNVYIELLAEYGLFGFLTFLSFLGLLAYNLYKNNSINLLAGLCVVLLYFVAYPSFSVFFLWVFFAIISLNKSKLI